MDGHNESILEKWYSCVSDIEFAKLPRAGNGLTHTHVHMHAQQANKLP